MTKHTSQKGSALVWIIILVVVAIGIYYVAKHNAGNTSVNEEASTTPTSNQVSILVPSNIEAYKTEMAQFVQVGGADPVPTTKWVPAIVTPNTVSADPIRNAAEAAAEYIQTQAGTSSLIAYFKVVNGTAYVLLTFDLNGWAGVSVAQAEVHPLIEKALLNQPGITAVKFGYAPGDAPNSSSNANSSASIKTYSNPELGFEFTYPAKATIVSYDVVGGRSITISGPMPVIEIYAQSKEYGPNSSMVSATCHDGPNNTTGLTETVNGITFTKNDVSGQFGGMESASIAESYCTVHSGTRYRVITRIPYNRVSGTAPDRNSSLQSFEQAMKSLNFTFTN